LGLRGGVLLKLRKATPEEVLRLRGIANYQFGWPAGDVLVDDDAVVGVSPGTRRIRELYGREGLLAVLRAHDYFFSLSLLGAKRLLSAFEKPRLRVVVGVERLESKSVPCRLVRDVDESLYAGEEVIVVNQSDMLLGVGRLRLSPVEIREDFCWGEAVRLRKLVG
jgi:archaeosine-15-forming tRNA-guanine transglycosylase